MSALSLALLGAALAAAEPPATAPRPLVPGQAVSATFTGAETHAYGVTLGAGDFLRLKVVQRGADVVVTVVAPDGTRRETDGADELVLIDAPFVPELASILAGPAGTYRIEIRPKAARPPRDYTIESEPPRPATPADAVRLRAEEALARPWTAAADREAGAGQAALAKLQAALADWDALGDAQAAALTGLRLALVQQGLNDLPAMARAADEARLAAVRAGDRHAEARALQAQAVALHYQFEYEQSAAVIERALEIRRALGDRVGEVSLLGTLGFSYNRLGERRKAVELQAGRVRLARESGNRAAEADALSDLAGAYVNANQMQQGIDTFRAAAALFREEGLTTEEAVCLQNEAAVRSELGDDAGALVVYEAILPFYQRGRSVRDEGTLLQNIAVAHSALGHSDQALALLERTLALREQSNDRYGVCFALIKLGLEHNKLRHYDTAADLFERGLRNAVEVHESYVESWALIGLGTARVGQGRAAEARELFRRAAAIDTADERRRAEALRRLAALENEAGELDAAQQHAEEALAILEGTRGGLASETLRTAFTEQGRAAYELYVDVLMGQHGRRPGQGFDARALEAAEKARARSLVDMLREGGLDLRQGADGALLEAERAAQERLSAAVDRQQRLARGGTEAQVQAAARAVQKLTLEWDAAREKIRSESPRFAGLDDPAPATMARIRRDVLDPGTLLLEYALGEKRSFLWVVGGDTLASHELPARAVIEAAAREALAELSEPSAPGRKGSAARRLGRLVLDPAAPALAGQRLLVVADGALHYVPFAALPDPGGGLGARRVPPDGASLLVARHEIVTAPSASVVALLREEAARRPRAERTLAVLADPVFTRDDARVARRAGAPARPSGDGGDATGGQRLASALRDAGVTGALARLPFTRREAAALLAMVPAGEGRGAFDFEASRATATDPALARYRYVHFATHGFVNSAHPALSGLVLSLVGRDGAETRGFLTTSDVFNLRLNAEMVVLSGCRTAVGQEMRGEGLVGLGRAFMYAGSPRVLASLWKVDDAATAALMEHLYRGILARGLAPAAALRAAQLEMVRRPRFRDPFYWASFQLQGEWR